MEKSVIRVAKIREQEDFEDSHPEEPMAHHLSMEGAVKAIVDDVTARCATRPCPVTEAEAAALTRHLLKTGDVNLLATHHPSRIVGIDEARVLEISGITRASYSVGTIEVLP